MIKEQKKIVQYLSDVQKNLPGNPKRIKSKKFFESWEQSCQPRPFIISGSVIHFGDHQIKLPKNGKYISYLAWNSKHEKPEFVFENSKAKYTFLIQIKSKNIEFKALDPIDVAYLSNSDAEDIEVMYDIIDQLISKKGCTDIFKLNKNEYIQALNSIADNYDKKLINKIAKISSASIKALIKQAASDMAIDDLSTQLCLPITSSYAYGLENNVVSFQDEKPEAFFLYAKTQWERAQDLEMLLSMAQFNYELQKEFILPLSLCELIETNSLKRKIIRISGIKDISIFEGSAIEIYEYGQKECIGTFTIQLFDYDTIYGELILQQPDYVKKLKYLYLKPKKAPLEFLLSKIKALYDMVCNHSENICGALRFILGIDTATISLKGCKDALHEMDFSQKTAWSASVNFDNPLIAVQGPPGTGKTYVLIQIIRHLVKKGNRILITAPSNVAVDNICKQILDLPVLRFGQPDKIDPNVLNTCYYGNVDHLGDYLEKQEAGIKGSIYAATHVRMLTDELISKDYHGKGLFDVIIFDEAGMSRMDEFLLCAQLAKRAIVFGDHQQLPPFSLSDEVLKKLNENDQCISSRNFEIIKYSAIEWLTHNRNLPLIMLQRSYRCQNPRLLRFASTLFYQAQVKVSEKAEYLKLPYYERIKKYPRSTLCFYRTSFLPEEIRKEKMVLDSARFGIENPCEALLCQKTLIEVIPFYSLDQISIISPYKRQVNLIKELLRYDKVKDQLPKSITWDSWDLFLRSRVATVDSFQGGESDLVIISYVRSNKNHGIGFVDNPNRINVAHTRSKRRIIIIGDLECLKQQAKTNIFNKMERAFLRDGEIIDVSKLESFLIEQI